MEQQNLHEKLQQASQQIKEAKEAVLQAQGSDMELMDQAHQLLHKAEEWLQNAQSTAGSEATENPQFQQAYQQLHDTRQQVTEGKQNIGGVFKI